MGSVIESFAAPALVPVTRFEPGRYDDAGVYQAGPSAQIMVRAAVLPLTGRELVTLPEGERNREHIKIYTEDELFTADEAAFQPADIVHWAGREFKVTGVQHRTEIHELAHYRSVAVLKDIER